MHNKLIPNIYYMVRLALILCICIQFNFTKIYFLCNVSPINIGIICVYVNYFVLFSFFTYLIFFFSFHFDIHFQLNWIGCHSLTPPQSIDLVISIFSYIYRTIRISYLHTIIIYCICPLSRSASSSHTFYMHFHNNSYCL